MGKVYKRIGAVLAFIFLGLVLVRGSADLPVLNFRSSVFWAGISVALALYVCSQVVSACAWKSVLLICGSAQPIGRAESQLFVSQIGKYIPGNFAHIFGRLSLAFSDGVGGAVAGAAMVLEVGILLTTGMLISGGIILVSPDLVSQLTASLPRHADSVLPILGGLMTFAGLVLGQFIIRRSAGQNMPTLIQFCLPWAFHTFNFALLGMSLWCVTAAIAPETPVPVLHCIAVFTIAWIAGFLAPGVPGGVGIRDGIIALGLELFVGHGSGLGIAVAHRTVSILGDVVVLGLGLLLRKQQV